MWKWFTTLFSGKPHFYIGGIENPYMLRWYLLPRNEWLNLYLHKFMRDDEDRALHDHPWWFLSWMLKGKYIEHTPNGIFRRSWLSIAFRRATHTHRVELLKDIAGKPVPCWTLVLTGSKSREWGFWCPKGFIPWFDFVDHSDEGNIGKGCGE